MNGWLENPKFNNVDADRSGFVDADELKVLLTLMNDSKVPTESEVRRIMESADSSGDGELDFLEFLALVKGMRAEKKANGSIFKSMGKMMDTIKQDVFGDALKEIGEYRTRAYRWGKFNTRSSIGHGHNLHCSSELL